MGNFHLPQPLNKEGNQLIQEYRHQNSIQNHQHDTATTGAKKQAKKTQVGFMK